jgi:hypothetical protein
LTQVNGDAEKSAARHLPPRAFVAFATDPRSHSPTTVGFQTENPLPGRRNPSKTAFFRVCAGYWAPSSRGTVFAKTNGQYGFYAVRRAAAVFAFTGFR